MRCTCWRCASSTRISPDSSIATRPPDTPSETEMGAGAASGCAAPRWCSVDPLNASVTATPAAGGPSADQPHAGHIVGRGMLALVFSQLITTPISIVVNALLARTLGASDFGAIYFAITALGVW